MTAPVHLVRRLVAEALGTGLLLATVVGTGVMAARLTPDAAMQLLANAVATGAILMVLITTFGPLSGAHFNPAVSVFLLRGAGTGWPVVGAYVLAQCMGAIGGVILAHLMFDLPAITLSATARSGPGQWLAEAVASFGLMLTILLAARTRPESIPTLVGLFIAAAYWFTASTSFANPAATLARGLTGAGPGISLSDAPAFMAMQVAGAGAAFGLARWLTAGAGRPGEISRA